VEFRWAGRYDQFHPYAAELVAGAPDVIFAGASTSVAALLQASRSVPIVFASVIDPVGAGFVTSLSRPLGSVTGCIRFEYSLTSKRLALLKEIAPKTTRVAVVRNSTLAAGIGQFASVQTAAASSAIELSAIDIVDGGAMEREISAFAGEPNGGLI